MVEIIKKRCNIFGNNESGAKVVLGGLADPKNEKTQWYCPNEADGRYRMACVHGHVGQVMHLCPQHLKQYAKSVTFCPACNRDPANSHTCMLAMYSIS